MADLIEVVMVVCFGISWPINILKAWRARTARGSSVLFYSFIFIGYLFGLGSKAVKLSAGIETPFYVWFFYMLNAAMVATGIIIHFRNAALDREAAEQSAPV